MNSECDNIKEKIADLVSGMLSESQVQTVEQHLDECADCREYARALKHEDGLLTEFFTKIDTNMTERQERVVKAINRSYVSEQSDNITIWRIIMKSRITKLAAAAVIIVGVSIGISYISKDHPGNIALGEVIKAMQQVKTITWTEIHEVNPPEDKEGVIYENRGHVARCAYKAPGRRRRDVTTKLMPNTEIIEHRHISIIDLNAGKALLLAPQEMTAELHSFKPASVKDLLYDIFLNPERNIPPEAEVLGSKKIGNNEAVGFRILKKGDGTDFWSGDIAEIWVDVKTKRVALIETGAADGGWMFRTKNFVFDLELDDSLFSLEAPEGYKEIAPRPVMQLSPPEQE
ncbi:MAG: zf-HC2 domain-containing protein [Planctomycetota bacterium]|jgi:hypothetical protein